MIIVSNSSPLIILARLNRFDLLQSLFGEIHISEEVHREVTQLGKGRPGAIRTQQATWIRVKAISDHGLQTQMSNSYNLGAGEISTIVLAKDLQADLALIDERKARLVAGLQGIPVLGSVGILEMGHRKGLVPDLRMTYQELERQGIRIDRRILNESLVKHNLPPL